MGKSADCDPGDYIDIGDVDILNGATAITLACWVNVDSSAATNKNPYVISKWDAFATFNYYLSLDGTSGVPGLEFGIRNGSNYLIRRVSTSEYATNIYDLLVPGEWNHIAATWDYNGGSPQYAIYINGVSMATDTRSSSGTVTSIGDQTNNLWLGILESGAAAQYSLNGKLAHVQIWDDALSSADIALVMRNPAYVPSNLVGWWPLNDSSDIGVDLSSSGNDGTNSGFSVQTDGPPLQMSGGSTRIVKELDQIIYVSDSSNSPPKQISDYPVSMCAWVRQKSLGTVVKNIIGFSDSADANKYLAIDAYNSKFRVKANIGAGQYSATGTTTISADTWYFVCGVFSGTTLREIYVNGVKENQNTTSLAYQTSQDTANVGGLYRAAIVDPYDGNIAHAQIYSKALSTDEQSNIMRNPYSGPRGSLLWHLPLDKPGDCGRDLSAYGYDGTEYNNPMTANHAPGPIYSYAGGI